MTRAKNKKDLTPEEKRAQALVPPEEQPYEVPGNWRWVRGAELFQPMEQRRPTGETFQYIDIDAIDNNRQIITNLKVVPTEKAPSRAVRSLKDGDTLFSMVRPYLKNIAYISADMENAIASSGFYVCRGKSFIDSRFLFNMMKTPYVVNGLNKNMKGDNSPSIRKGDIENFLYPIPPLHEQRRIVDRIERLFAALDAAKEKSQSVLASGEARKAAILHKAFTGELTVAWRKRHNIQLDNWKTTTLQSVCLLKITDGTHQTPTYCDEINGIPFISAKDVTSGEICWNNVKYITPELHKELHKRFAPQVNDVLLAKNGTTGVAAIVDVDKVFDIYVTLAVLRPNTEVIIPRYLLNVVNSPLCKKQFDEHLRGIGVPNLHLRDIKEVQISLPTLAEQEVIVYIIDKFLNKNAQIQNAALSVLTRIAAIKQSILARAFRGELGTNDPAEPAAEL